MVCEASKLGLHVKLNTNGSRITEDLARELVQAGLNTICVSLYSHVPEVHNTIRGNPLLRSHACRSMEVRGNLKREHRSLRVETQSVILRENFRGLDELLRFHYELGSERILLSYLEGDFSREHVPTESEITELREDVLPKVTAFCLSHPTKIRRSAVSAVETIYDPAHGSPARYSKGYYGYGEFCGIPQYQALIQATGDLHPCNIVEYLHRPVMGNLFQKRLPELWRSRAWNDFRESRPRSVRSAR